MPKLTKRLIESTMPQDKDTLLWDTDIRGFFCKITPHGKRIYMVYYRTRDGRQRRPKIGEHGAITCEQARGIAQSWLAEVAQGKDPSAQKGILKAMPTLRELSIRYMAEHAPRKKLSSRRTDASRWKHQILPRLGDLKVSAITREDIVNLHTSLQSTPSSANHVVRLLSKALNLAELWGYRPDGSNPCRHIKQYAENKRERFLSQEEISRLGLVLSELEENNGEPPAVICAIRLLLLTGCRRNEILTLRWEDVDWDKGFLMLPDSKTGKRTVYLSPQAMDILKSAPVEEGNPYVIIGKKRGTHLTTLQYSWPRIRKQAGLDNVRLHDLRHTFASVAAASGFSLLTIGALLGHRQTKTTARYAHLVGQPLMEAASKIGERIALQK